ncbi:MAG: VOC family protein [Cyanobacteria bacterium P01_H01_bin.130]
MLNLVVLRTQNMEHSRRFYESIGLQFEHHRHGNGLPHLSSIGSGAVVEIYPANGKDTTDLRLGFQVENMDQVLQTLEALGGSIISPAKPSPWGRRAVVKDGDGHTVELCEIPG